MPADSLLEMALYLFNPAVELTLELFVAPQIEEAIAIQWERIADKNVRTTYTRRLEVQLEKFLQESLDWDIKPPTPAQISYARLIARKRNIRLPSEAQKFRFHTSMFLATYAPGAASSPPPEDEGEADDDEP